MKRSRLASRLRIAARALGTLAKRRRKPSRVARILVAHQLLLGDTLMLTPLLARLRRKHPAADIVMVVGPALLDLYAGRPYGVRAVPWDPHSADSFSALRRERGFDLAFIPGDNRHALLARALDARWIVALQGDTPNWKNRLCDELVPWPQAPTALADIFASLAGEGDEGYDSSQWPAPPCTPFQHPGGSYAVLHVGAGSALRLWSKENWRALAEYLEERAIKPVLIAGPGEEALIAAIDPLGRFRASGAPHPLAQLWHLIAGAQVLVCLDSGISHLAKHIMTPTVALYGPGTPVLFGPGRFWRDAPFAAVWDESFACRDQHSVFKRQLGWARRCQRTSAQCTTRPRCMEELALPRVIAAVDRLLQAQATFHHS